MDKPQDHGGLEISRYVTSGILAAVIVALILILPQRAGVHPGAREQKAQSNQYMRERKLSIS